MLHTVEFKSSHY